MDINGGGERRAVKKKTTFTIHAAIHVKGLPTLDSFIKAKFRRVVPRLCESSPAIDQRLPSTRKLVLFFSLFFFFLSRANYIF